MVNLHNHSTYSFLDGLSTVEGMAKRAKELGQKAVAITDHGTLAGILDFYKACKAEGVKPIIGMEAYFTRSYKLKGKSHDVNTHLLLIAQNETGYKNLVKIASLGGENFYHRPRVDLRDVTDNAEGIICTSACLGSPFAKHFLSNDLDLPWRDSIEGLIEAFKGRFFFETQTYDNDLQREYNRVLREEARKRGVPVIVTSDAHYLTREDYETHDVLLAIQSGKDLDDPNRMRHECNTLYMHSEDELVELGFPREEISNTDALADMCDLELKFTTKFPKVENAVEQIRETCTIHLNRIPDEETKKAYEARVTEEIEVIQKCGFPEYFVILSDIVNWARKAGIRVGPSRGSSAGSLVCKYLGITEIDPIEHGLLFYRFLNPDRIGLPDIDVDFQDNRRKEVVDYVIEKYGKDSVAGISTIHKVGVKQAFKDVARTVKIPFGESAEITKLIPDDAKSFSEALKSSDALFKKMEEIKIDKEVLKHVDKLVGIGRQPSRHAAGMVIAPGKITDFIPTTRSKDGELMTMFDMNGVEQTGLVKFDMLGLCTLSVISEAIDLAVSKGKDKEEIEEEIRSYNDPDTYKMIADGVTAGCFQIETAPITKICKRVRVSSLSDLAQVVSIYRPAVLQTPMFEQYFKNRENPDKVNYIIEEIADLLRETYGIMLYQEQQMLMSMKIADFTPSKADQLRKGSAKKKPELILPLKNEFLEGAAKHGHENEESVAIWKLLEQGGYGFNKAHAVGYSAITYQTAYLKKHYPLEFMCALINSEETEEKIQIYLFECFRLGIDVLPVHINKSGYFSKVEKGAIRLGMKIVKGIGQNVADELSALAPFDSLEDFVEKAKNTSITSKSLIVLTKAGALDDLGYNRREMLYSDADEDPKIFKAMASAKKYRNKDINQTSLFGSTSQLVDLALPDLEDFTEEEKKDLEFEVTRVSRDSLMFQYRDRIESFSTTTSEKLEALNKGANVMCVGVVFDPAIFNIKGKYGKQEMLRFSVKTVGDVFGIIMFAPNSEVKQEVKSGNTIVVDGEKTSYRGESEIIAKRIRRLRKEMFG